jgi:hypothetical protein
VTARTLTTPIVLIVYNRPDFTKVALDRIAASNPGPVLIISDGPRAEKVGDEVLVNQTREICNQRHWSFPISLNAAEHNMGLRNRILTGLDWVFENHQAAIILEDDCAPDPTFFPFIEDALDFHRGSKNIGIVSGNNFCGRKWETPYSYGFSTTARIWGWGTWRHVWQQFSQQEELRFSWSADEQQSIASLIAGRARRQAMKKMLRAGGSLDACSLAFSVFLLRNGFLNVVPRVNLVENIGFGERSTHTKFESFTSQIAAQQLSVPLDHPPGVVHDEWIETAESKEYWRTLMTYPIKHPFDVAGRIWRYLRLGTR